MIDDEKEKLIAMQTLLSMTHDDDWHLFHATVRSDVKSGKLSVEFENAYRELVDKMAEAIEAERDKR